MSLTYTSLKQRIQDFCENDETTFVNNLDTFITTAEERILKSVDLDYFKKNVSAATTASNKFLSLPTDYLSSFSLAVTDGAGRKSYLTQKDASLIEEFNPTDRSGLPRYYAPYDVSSFILAPVPDAAYAVELNYFYRPVSITASTDGTTWLGTNAPNALLYACLVESYIFMKGEQPIISLYEARYAESIARLKNYGEGLENTDTYREGLVRTIKS